MARSPAAAGDPDSEVHPEPKWQLLRASTTFYDRVVNDWWYWELLSWTVSFSCVAAIVGVLIYYDGKMQPKQVVLGITLNGYISVFAAIAKAAMILPVSEAIGQLKWMWFRQERRLSNFSTFDNASRGPWGSLMLLGTTKCGHLVSLGAAITILALAFEPFFQQIVSFPSRNISQTRGTVSIATGFLPVNDIALPYAAGFNGGFFYGGQSVASDVANAISTKDGSVMSAPSLCPTGRCDWAPYSSLGVCHKCEDISHLLSPVCGIVDIRYIPFNNPCGYLYANGTLFTGVSGVPRQDFYGLTTAVVGSQLRGNLSQTLTSTAFQHASHAILDFYVAFTPGGASGIQRNATPVMLECLYQWCVKTYKASYNNGSLQESTITSYLPGDDVEASNNPPEDPSNGIPNDPFVMMAADTAFHIAANTTRSLTNALLANLPLRLMSEDSTEQYPGKWSFVQNAPHDINAVLGPVTEAMTNHIRSSRNNDTETFWGDAWIAMNMVETQWLWIILPGGLLLSTLALICSTILQGRKSNVPMWKSSALATLLHGLTEEVRSQFDANASQSEVDKMSEGVRVKLSSISGTGRLVAV